MIGQFIFQFYYEHFLTFDCLQHDKVKTPLPKCQNIMLAMFTLNIWLINLYSYVCKPLSLLLAKFVIANGFTVDFPHICIQPRFLNCYGMIPALKWYNPNPKSTSKRQELIEWHQESQEVVLTQRCLIARILFCM